MESSVPATTEENRTYLQRVRSNDATPVRLIFVLRVLDIIIENRGGGGRGGGGHSLIFYAEVPEPAA